MKIVELEVIVDFAVVVDILVVVVTTVGWDDVAVIILALVLDVLKGRFVDFQN
jgi:hypothetical protein